ncbi:hypothetical protein SAMN02910356_00861 [Selenomonas sp. GACV-9]|uniref:hypothetical protein n=1 Tax=Selenomonas sp. GACV-9 TaxID=3158782 RepID=UPI0008F06557|nr:hypothetical protein SAMN02910356_00861 [Selenomonas ruminantium]
MRYRWFVREEERTDEFGNPISRAVHDEALQPRKIGYARGELLAIAMAVVILLYEWVTDDSPLIFVCVSFLVHEMRPLALQFLGEYGKPVSNMMLGFSVALFIGALVWTFL